MSWENLSAEIADEFAALEGAHDLNRDTLLYDHGSRLEMLKEEEASDPAWRAWISRGREAKRRRKVASDPVYAAKRKAQTAAAYQRRKALDTTTPHARYPWGERSLTIAQWAREPDCAEGVTAHAIRLRLKRGWTIEAAVVTAPKGRAKQPEKRMTKPKTMTVPADMQRRIEDEAAAMGVAPVQVLRACIEVAMRREDKAMDDLVFAVEDECRNAVPGRGLRVLR